jgi:hypothetical protein
MTSLSCFLRDEIPTSPFLFCGCFFVAFVGAVLIAWSQIDDSSGASTDELVQSLSMAAGSTRYQYQCSSRSAGRWWDTGSEKWTNQRRSLRTSSYRRAFCFRGLSRLHIFGLSPPSAAMEKEQSHFC